MERGQGQRRAIPCEQGRPVPAEPRRATCLAGTTAAGGRLWCSAGKLGGLALWRLGSGQPAASQPRCGAGWAGGRRARPAFGAEASAYASGDCGPCSSAGSVSKLASLALLAASSASMAATSASLAASAALLTASAAFEAASAASISGRLVPAVSSAACWLSRNSHRPNCCRQEGKQRDQAGQGGRKWRACFLHPSRAQLHATSGFLAAQHRSHTSTKPQAWQT